MAITGPNGAGKSSLLRLIYRYHTPDSGRILLDGADLSRLNRRTSARIISAVLQEQSVDFALTVREVVALGRLPHTNGMGRMTARDNQIVDDALANLDLEELADRPFWSLSGGQRQCAAIARALAQEPSILVLDEPTNNLDIRRQLEILELLCRLDLTVICALHDLSLASTYADDVLLLQAGRAVAHGPPVEVLREDLLARVFDIAVRVNRNNGRTVLHYDLPQKEVIA